MSLDSHMTIAIAQADVPNLIGNIYTQQAITKMHEECNKAMEGGFLGGMVRDDAEQIDLSRVTHRITKVDVIDDFLVVDVSFMETPEGEIARKLVESAAGIIRPTIHGSLDPLTMEVTVDKVVSFDIIAYNDDHRLHITWKKLK